MAFYPEYGHGASRLFTRCWINVLSFRPLAVALLLAGVSTLVSGCLLMVERDPNEGTDSSPDPDPVDGTDYFPSPLELFTGLWEYGSSDVSLDCTCGQPLRFAWEGFVIIWEGSSHDLEVSPEPIPCDYDFDFDNTGKVAIAATKAYCTASFSDAQGNHYSSAEYEFDNFRYTWVSSTSLKEEREVVIRYQNYNDRSCSCSGSSTSALARVD